MFREFFCAKSRATCAFAWFGLLIFVGHAVFKAFISVRLNSWYEDFYDVLQAPYEAETVDENRQEIYDKLIAFTALVAPVVVVHPIASYIGSRWRLSWRMALLTSYLTRFDTSRAAIEGKHRSLEPILRENTTLLMHGG